MLFSTEYYSYMYIVTITLQGFSIVGNSFIITVFLSNLSKHFRNYKLKTNKSLYLVPVLCFTNAMFSLSALPFTVYQFVMMRNNKILFNPFLLASASTPTMIDFKLNLIITIMIAIVRVQAIKYPIFYRNKNHKKFVYFTVGIGLVAGLIDTVIGIVTVDYSMKEYKCPSVGCFQTIVFPIYWSSSIRCLQKFLRLVFLMAYLTEGCKNSETWH